MARTYRTRAATALGLLLAAFAGACQAAPGAVHLRGDFDCDGRPDMASLRQTYKGIVVRVSFAERWHRTQTFSFPIDPAQENALCRLPVHLQLESLEYNAKAASGYAPGFVRSTHCKGFAVVDNACDSIHFYWNHKRNRLAWWRA